MIKHFTLLILLAFTSLAINAQIKKGSTLLGGQISSYNTSSNNFSNEPVHKYNSAEFNISVGKAFRNNLVNGFNFSYNYSDDYNSINVTKHKSYGIGVFNKRYKKLISDFYLFMEFGAKYIHSNLNTTDPARISLSTAKGNAGLLGMTPGISYKILNKLNLEISIPSIFNAQYSITKGEQLPFTSKDKTFSLFSNLSGSLLSSLGIGIRFVL